MDEARFALIVRMIAAVKNVKAQNPLSDAQMMNAAPTLEILRKVKLS